MAYFKFDSPLKACDKVSFHFRNKTYNGTVNFGGPVWYVVLPEHRDTCYLLSKAFPKEFAVGKRAKVLSQFNYDKDTKEFFPEFSTAKDLEDFLNYFNEKYSEL